MIRPRTPHDDMDDVAQRVVDMLTELSGRRWSFSDDGKRYVLEHNSAFALEGPGYYETDTAMGRTVEHIEYFGTLMQKIFKCAAPRKPDGFSIWMSTTSFSQ